MVYLHYKLIPKQYWIKFFLFHFYRYHKIFFCSLIFKGNKLWAFTFFNKLKLILKLKFKKDPNFLFLISMCQITPSVLLFPFKIGGKIQGVPLPISWRKKWTFATKWVIKLLRDKLRLINLNDLSLLLSLAIFGKGLALKKKNSYNISGSKNRYLMKYFK
jgi:ribosomal protein S7